MTSLYGNLSTAILKAPSAVPDTKYEELQKIGACTYAALAEMVAALECDYDRLEELRDERDAFAEDDGHSTKIKWEDTDEAEELKELEAAAGECESREDAEQRIHDDPLSVEVREDWHAPGEPGTIEEFCILLGTGGPATRIIGELDGYGQPKRCRLQAQDWFTAWTDYTGGEHSTLLTYCQQFYFGEG
jgi:hypothetical protein